MVQLPSYPLHWDCKYLFLLSKPRNTLLSPSLCLTPLPVSLYLSMPALSLCLSKCFFHSPGLEMLVSSYLCLSLSIFSCLSSFSTYRSASFFLQACPLSLSLYLSKCPFVSPSLEIAHLSLFLYACPVPSPHPIYLSLHACPPAGHCPVTLLLSPQFMSTTGVCKLPSSIQVLFSTFSTSVMPLSPPPVFRVGTLNVGTLKGRLLRCLSRGTLMYVASKR